MSQWKRCLEKMCDATMNKYNNTKIWFTLQREFDRWTCEFLCCKNALNRRVCYVIYKRINLDTGVNYSSSKWLYISNNFKLLTYFRISLIFLLLGSFLMACGFNKYFVGFFFQVVCLYNFSQYVWPFRYGFCQRKCFPQSWTLQGESVKKLFDVSHYL